MSNLEKTIKKCRDLAYGECEPNFYYGMDSFSDEGYEQIANWLEVLNSLDEQISALYEDIHNGAGDDVMLGWNRALDKVREIIKAGVVDG